MSNILYNNIFINITSTCYKDASLALTSELNTDYRLYNSMKGFYKASIKFSGDVNTSIVGEFKRIADSKQRGELFYIINSYYLNTSNIILVSDALKMLFANFYKEKKHLIVIGDISFLSKDTQDLFIKVSLSSEIEAYKKAFINRLAEEVKINITYTDIEELKLLSSQQIYNVFKNSKNAADLKKQRENMLSFTLLERLDNDITFSHIGSWGRVKNFVKKTLKPLLHLEKIDIDIPLPTNILLSGVSGNGKTSMAKAIANELGYNIYKVDTGILYNKYLGNTEKNMRILWEEIKRVSPAAILFDELEKILAGVSSSDSVDAGTTARLLSYVLTQLQDHNTKSVIVGTINNKEGLPPELLRLGRWDLKYEQKITVKYIENVIFALLKRYNITNSITKFNLKHIYNNIHNDTGAGIESEFKQVIYKLLCNKSEINFTNFMGVLNESNSD